MPPPSTRWGGLGSGTGAVQGWTRAESFLRRCEPDQVRRVHSQPRRGAGPQQDAPVFPKCRRVMRECGGFVSVDLREWEAPSFSHTRPLPGPQRAIRGEPDCGAATRRYSSFSAGPHFSVASDPIEDGLGVLGSRRSGSGVLGSRRVGFGTRVGREGWRCGVRWGCRCGWRRGVRRRRGEAGVEVRERASVMTGERIFRPDSIGPMCTSTPLSCWTHVG